MEIQLKGEHPTLGMQLDDRNMHGRIKLLHCEKGTPAYKMKKWRSVLRNSNIIEVENQPVATIAEIQDLIRKYKSQGKPNLTCTFATEERVTIHPTLGTPQLYFDQLNIIAKHLYECKTEEEIVLESDHIIPAICHVKKKKGGMSQFTRTELRKRDDWEEWNKPEMTQLDNYATQDMFENPIPRPAKANVLSLLWTYLVKSDGTKKARCVCNGSPKSKGTVTLAHTFAACLEQPGARTFWAAAALMDMIVVGADASNAFAEAPSPKAPLYVVVDQQFREWWKKQGKGEIPKGYVMKVKHALQGHPESPRLWAKMIDEIIRTHVGLQPTSHEPRLYEGEVEGEKVLFLRQVDDFAVACKNVSISKKVIDLISAHLSAPMKHLGIIDRFNGSM